MYLEKNFGLNVAEMDDIEIDRAIAAVSENFRESQEQALIEAKKDETKA